jgi:hypothetical protein
MEGCGTKIPPSDAHNIRELGRYRQASDAEREPSMHRRMTGRRQS